MGYRPFADLVLAKALAVNSLRCLLVSWLDLERIASFRAFAWDRFLGFMVVRIRASLVLP